MAQTSFFDVHQPIYRTQDNLSTISEPSGAEEGNSAHEVKLEDSSSHSRLDTRADYHVKGMFFNDPDAFNTFVKYLYNEPPPNPANRKQLKILYQTYGIARQ